MNRFRVLSFTDDVEKVRTFIDETRAEGGADTPEDLDGGLKLALLQDWTEEASKRVFLISDAPAHGYYDGQDDYPKGSPDGLKLDDLMREFSTREIEFQFYQLDKNCDKMVEEMRKYHESIEVNDMTDLKPQSGKIFHSGARDGGLTGFKKARSADDDCFEESRDKFRNLAVKSLSQQVAQK